MCGTVEHLKSNAGDSAGDGKRLGAVESLSRGKRQHRAASDQPKYKCRCKSRIQDVARRYETSILQAEEVRHEPEVHSEYQRKSPSASIRQAPRDSADQTRYHEVIRL